VTGTSAACDAINRSRSRSPRPTLTGRELVVECADRETGEIAPLTIVTDNGPAFKSLDFLRFFARRTELRHVRTRHHAPETNGVVERFNQSLKYEHLYREEIADVLALAEAVEAYRELYNWVRPHEAIGFVPPMARYLASPGEPHLSGPEGVQET
jgi:transposase InsO family protein